MSTHSTPVDPRLVDVIEKSMRDHSLVREDYDRLRDRVTHICKCGTRHPDHDGGRWPTHERHRAEQAALATQTHLAAT